MDEKMQIPHFQLQRVYEDGSRDEPEVHALTGIDATCRMGRRGFLLTSAIGAGLLASLVVGCDSEPETSPDFQRVTLNPPEKEISTGNVRGITAHKGKANTVAFSPDGAVLASGGDDSTVKLWSMRDGTLLKALTGHKAKIMGLAFTPDSKQLISESYDGSLHFWSMPDGALQKTLQREAAYFYVPFRVSPDGRMLATMGGPHSVLLHDLSSGASIGKLVHKGVSAFAFSPDGAILATGQGGETINEVFLWALPSLKKRQQRRQNAGKLFFSADGDFLIVKASLYDLDVLAFPSLVKLKSLWFDTKSISSTVDVSPDGKWLATGDGYIAVLLTPMSFEGESLLLKGYGPGPNVGKNKREWEKEYLLNAVSFSANSEYLAAAYSCGSVYVWTLTPDEQEATFHAALFDPNVAAEDVSVRQATLGGSRAYVGSCGDPLPAGAVCTCNCVSGKISRPKPRSFDDFGRICTCDSICTCVPVK